jgi:predicted ATPase
MLKAIHAQESREAADQKATAVIADLRASKLSKAAELVEQAVHETLSAARVDGFGSGVNVLAAGNEVGKSTLFKAIRTCLFCRHDSKTQDIRDLGSDDSQLPATVQLAFEHDGKAYTIKKSFLRSPSAVLCVAIKSYLLETPSRRPDRAGGDRASFPLPG